MLVYENSHEYHRKKKVHYLKITNFFKASQEDPPFFDFHLSMGTSFDRACKAESTSKFW